MIALVDEDRDGKISFREFMMIFRKQDEGALESDSGLDKLVKLTEIDVSATVKSQKIKSYFLLLDIIRHKYHIFYFFTILQFL